MQAKAEGIVQPKTLEVHAHQPLGDYFTSFEHIWYMDFWYMDWQEFQCIKRKNIFH